MQSLLHIVCKYKHFCQPSREEVYGILEKVFFCYFLYPLYYSHLLHNLFLKNLLHYQYQYYKLKPDIPFYKL